MPPLTPSLLLLLSAFAQLSLSAPASSTSSAAFPCISSGDQTAINARFSDNGAGHVVQLCRGAVITATDTVRLTADDQELSTEGYPTGDDRGVIRLAAGTSANTTVFAKFLDGVRLRNIIVDGNRGSTGYTGISFQCTDSTISDNSVIGSTDGGIVIFGAPGTKVLRNTITSSATERGFGAINLVDQALYGGSYANVEVRDNTITGDKLFNVGISIGAHVWSFGSTAGFENAGPITVTGNTFAGNIPFAIAVNGWRNGLTITDNTITGLTTPPSSFASASTCSAPIQRAFAASQRLVYYAPSIAPPSTLSADFAATSANATNYLCTTPGAAAATASFAPNELAAAPPATLAALTDAASGRGVVFAFQGDGNFVAYDTTSDAGGAWVPLWAAGGGVECGAQACALNFQGDGNLVMYAGGGAVWNTRTAGVGAGLVLSAVEPWVRVVGEDGEAVWTSEEGVFEG
ncbi:right-handed beta helix region protein [Neofusicoccum parvum]|uniref:Right-handed beta helix region protein n=1 Tax=Neofusicoccum parvum TaxID=310453 RepID=A0ACB5SIQ2_9PEZI|nr:right-handed beta helix region protein [Neofusicoccum parvum]